MFKFKKKDRDLFRTRPCMATKKPCGFHRTAVIHKLMAKTSYSEDERHHQFLTFDLAAKIFMDV